MQANDEEETFSDWEEDEGTEMPTHSLFGPSRVLPTPSECMRAAKREFGFDLLGAARALGLYERIQLVNYIRARAADLDAELHPALVEAVAVALAAPGARAWKEERFLQPVVEGDPLLFSMGELDDNDDDDAPGTRVPDEDDVLIAAALTVDDPTLDTGELAKQMAQMRNLLQDMAVDDSLEPASAAPGGENDESGDEAGANPSTERTVATGASAGGSGSGNAGRRRRQAPPQRTMAEKVDEGYFGSYEGLGIYHTMLSDRVRTLAYQRAIQQPWMRGKNVLDIGCGTAILSLFAASAGAEHVYGVDASNILLKAQEVVRWNGLDEKITLLRGKAEEIALPVPKVDVIISEWMGYCLLYEAMLPSVLAARDKWLAPGGLVMPNRATMQMRASSHSEVTFWDNVYGFDMSTIGAAMGEDKEADVIIVPAESALSEQMTFHTIDIMTVKDEELDFNAPFELVITSAGTLRTFVSSFETIFDPPAGVEGCEVVWLKTGMSDEPTHWKQTLFHIKEPVAVEVGETVRGRISCARLGEGRRDLDFSITWGVVRADGGVRVQERSQLWQV
mmetsp:Transcript_43443/g.100542  ORF Transcript_43443/g.100542 Transcript_43443/m.100542 type:complete len:564 (-) Transcript_43443:307-1998(-)